MLIKQITPEEMPDALKKSADYILNLVNRNRSLRICILCRCQAKYLYIYTPGNERRSLLHQEDLPEGKDRHYIYALCEGCTKKLDFAEQAAQVIMSISTGRNITEEIEDIMNNERQHKAKRSRRKR